MGADEIRRRHGQVVHAAQGQAAAAGQGVGQGGDGGQHGRPVGDVERRPVGGDHVVGGEDPLELVAHLAARPGDEDPHADASP